MGFLSQKYEWLIVLFASLTLLMGCSFTEKTVEHSTEANAMKNEVTLEPLHITIAPSLPSTYDGTTYDSVAVTLYNDSDDVINFNEHDITIDVINTNNTSITNEVHWFTNATHGVDFTKLKNLKPKQSVTGHVYYNAPTAVKSIDISLDNNTYHTGIPEPYQIKRSSPADTRLDNTNIETKVIGIRKSFNHIEENIRANQMDVTALQNTTWFGAGEGAYYKAVHNFYDMTYHFYYMDNSLFFVYTYPNKHAVNFENRYYFSDGQLIRWLRSDETIINFNEGQQDDSYLQEQANILFLSQQLDKKP